MTPASSRQAAGHKLGTAEHNDDKPAGPGVLDTNLGVFVGKPVSAQSDDSCLQSFVDFAAPAAAKLGHVSMSGEFVFEGDAGDVPYPGFLTLIYSGGVDIAMTLGGEIFSLSGHNGSLSLSDPNPLNLSVLQTARLVFDLDGAQAELTLHATVDSTTGGFTLAVPESPGGSLVAIGLLALVMVAGRRAAPAIGSRRGRRYRGFVHDAAPASDIAGLSLLVNVHVHVHVHARHR